MHVRHSVKGIAKQGFELCTGARKLICRKVDNFSGFGLLFYEEVS